MSKFWHVFVHVIAVGAQLVNVQAGPGKYQTIVALALGLIQAGIAVTNHGDPKP